MLQIADFRQYNSTLLVHATQTTLDEPEDVDPEIVATHAQFGHSVNVAHDHYGLEGNQALTRLAADSIARMQKVSRNWHAFIGLLHPLLVKSVNEELQVTDSVFFPNKVLIITQLQLISVSGPPVTKAVLTSELKKTREALQTAVTIKMDHFNEILCKKMEYGYTEIRENLIHIHQTPNFSNPRRTPVHPSTLFALRRALGRNFDGFTSPEQAELIQSVGSSLHVFGIIETGGGKSMAFFAAPHLLPQSLFIVVSPLKALTADLERRLRETGVSGGVWKPDEPMKWESVQLVLASVDHCAGQRFLRYIQNDPIKSRLRRVFFDEAHKIHTDTNFRHCFELIHHLVRTGVPITFLSGSLMPRAIPYILRIMHISDPSIVDEIRRETHRPNLKYIIQKTDEERHFATLKGFIGEKMIQLDSHERGMVFTASKREADMLGSQLGIPVYHSDLPNNARTAAATLWHNGVLPTDRFIAATEAFGAGINEPHVKIVIHSNPRSLINFVQETGRAGRDGDPAHCYTFFHRLPPILSVQETEQYGDPSAQMEMREALQTLHCFRLTFRCMDGKARSCASLPKAQLCSNCEEYAQVGRMILVDTTISKVYSYI
ncbi:dna partial [Lentinula edodes]|uniref:DNA 3'-5' helicase n=1 Tax=Lentinula edodes TaxID=5353 RepID=A0A1Q3E5Q6_LENED|nr:dna partial [Lentinula edodes]